MQFSSTVRGVGSSMRNHCLKCWSRTSWPESAWTRGDRASTKRGLWHISQQVKRDHNTSRWRIHYREPST
ncbi:uncharacterized protein A1O9_06101 [Exophiala aquamarina CBS 119918]|uniref:Uncharacterized protein n=1 Tax=Exophiala aquamarina CBS 119918 TaxID=1182545 RepID=A0A072PRN2_9EURO|nr:uncharacterized protein A1O9_06101 [Exophiala aquamarina CBS 119918]KEF58175.1 hypothetical protein A1O9_06101 [Exophiala aquamarina CBS 119918]